MEKILNRGLNFCINPIKLNLTEVLVDFRKFERKMKWIEYRANKENKEEMEQEIFKRQKSNLLTTKSSKTLTNYICKSIEEDTGVFRSYAPCVFFLLLLLHLGRATCCILILNKQCVWILPLWNN